MDINTDDKPLFQFVTDARFASEAMRMRLQMELGLVMSYYEGLGWTRIAGPDMSRLQWLEVDRNPDSNGLRVAYNVSSRLVQRAAVATLPVKIDVDVQPPDRRIGIVSAAQCQVYEDTLNEMIASSRMQQHWADAAFGRSVCGSYGIGWCLAANQQYLGGEKPVNDVQLKAFSFLPIKLTLDPRNTSRNLLDHEYVIYSDAWTIGKIYAVYGDLLKKQGIQIDEKMLKVLSELASFEVTVNVMTQNRLFAAYRYESKSRGAIVHQIHRRSGRGGYNNFDLMDVLIELPATSISKTSTGMPNYIRLTPEGENQTPFGGHAMPFMLLHGHRRSDSMWGIGDQKMIVDDQDRINRCQTYVERQMQQNAWKQWLVDLRTSGKDKTSDALSRKFNNAVGGIITYESGMGQGNQGNPPSLVQHPQPQSFVPEMISRYEANARENVHRAEGHFGDLKTHVPDASFQRSLDEAGQVLDMRVAEDKSSMVELLKVGLGTICKRVQTQSPAVLGWLVNRGFDDMDLGTLVQTDPTDPPCTIAIRDSSIRQQSTASKKANLDTAAQLQTIAAEDYRRAMAQMDLPLTPSDREFNEACKNIATRVLMGEEWQPIPLGKRSDDLIEAFHRAIVDRAAGNPETKARLTRAIMGQMQMAQQEMAMLQPPQPAAPAPEQGTPDTLDGSFTQAINQVAGQTVPE